MKLWRNYKICISTILLICLFILFAHQGVSGGQGEDSSVYRWEQLRGFTVNGWKIKQSDIDALKATDANLIRLTFNTHPLMHKHFPYDFNENSLAKMEQVLDWCQTRGIRVVIDPHTTPGTKKNNTMRSKDEFWKDAKWHEHLARLWGEIARRCADRGDVIAGYDLMNEPSVPRNRDYSPKADWNKIVSRLVAEIRTFDKKHTIIIQPVPSRRFGKYRVYPLDGLQYLALPEDNNLVMSPHMYEPGSFTHQGLHGLPEPLKYPGEIRGRYWDKKALKEVMIPIRVAQERLGIPVFIGEFSAPRWTGNSGNQYLQDLMEIFEEYGWSYAYHKFRGADIWDAEKSNENRNDERRYDSTPRMDLLRKFFKLNRSTSPAPTT